VPYFCLLLYSLCTRVFYSCSDFVYPSVLLLLFLCEPECLISVLSLCTKVSYFCFIFVYQSVLFLFYLCVPKCLIPECLIFVLSIFISAVINIVQSFQVFCTLTNSFSLCLKVPLIRPNILVRATLVIATCYNEIVKIIL